MNVAIYEQFTRVWFQRGCLGQACWGSVQATYNAHWGTKQGVPFFQTTTSSLYLWFYRKLLSDLNMQEEGEKSTLPFIHYVIKEADNLSCANYRCLAWASWSGDGGRGNTPGQLPCQASWRGWRAREGPDKTVRRWRKHRELDVWRVWCIQMHELTRFQSSAYMLRRVWIFSSSQLVIRGI